MDGGSLRPSFFINKSIKELKSKMSRLTGNDAKSLMEAYAAVYAPHEEVELTEEQVWEEVENWVNSLVEEGYDLSEYSWEDMYNAYIEEQQVNIPNARQMGKQFRVFDFAPSAQKLLGKPGQKPTGSTPAPSRPAAPASRPAAAAPSRPAAPAARPAAAAPAAPSRPAAATAASKPAAPATSTLASVTKQASKPTAFQEPKKTPNPLMQRTFGYQTGQAPDQQKKASASNIISAGKSAAPAAPVNKATGSKKPGSIVSHYDPFDIVIGHLLDEGYADTEEAALAIMANMSEEWKNEIVELSETENVDEAMTSYERNRRRAAQRARERNEARKQGKTGVVPGVGYVTPRKERETWTDERGRERRD